MWCMRVYPPFDVGIVMPRWQRNIGEREWAARRVAYGMYDLAVDLPPAYPARVHKACEEPVKLSVIALHRVTWMWGIMLHLF